ELSDKEKEKLKKIADAKEKARQDELRKRQEAQEELFTFLLSEDEKEIQALNQKFEKLFNLNVANKEQTEQLEQMHQQALTDLIAEQEQKRLDAKKEAEEKADAEEKARREKELAEQLAFEKSKRDMMTETANVISGIGQIVRNVGKENEKAQKAALIIQKAASIARIAINLQEELAFIQRNAAANPLNIPTGGAAGISQSAIQSGIAIARAAVSTGVVLSQRFEKGGIIDGPSHAQGGVPILGGRAEVEGGEVILSKGVTENPGLLAAASQLNVMGGGKSFFQDGGVLPFNFPTFEVPSTDNTSSILAAISEIEFRPVVAVEEVTRAQSNVAVSESIATI
ncbi:MAG: hypothetical protein DRP97_08375, partial [Candidatus Latescibacterota bacterium]